jgi:tetratricopeptide (TPR) repeat protein
VIVFFRRRPVGPEYYFKRGKECLDRRDYHWALQSFSKAIEFFPDFKLSYYVRAEVYKELGMTREAVWDCIKFLEMDRRFPGKGADSFGLLDAAKLGTDIAGVDVLSSILNVLGTVKEQNDVASFEAKKIKMRKEIVSFGIPSLLEELIEGYSPERNYDDVSFYWLALHWLEENSAEKRHYVAFARLLLKDFDNAIVGFDEAIVEDPAKPDAYYFRGVAFLKKVGKTADGESASGNSGAYLDFCQALKNGFKWRVCPGCGYRTTSELNYCMLCGTKLLVG